MPNPNYICDIAKSDPEMVSMAQALARLQRMILHNKDISIATYEIISAMIDPEVDEILRRIDAKEGS